MLVRIDNKIWAASKADVRRFPDAFEFARRAPSARVAYILVSGEWFRASEPQYLDDRTAVTAGDLAKIDAAPVMKEGK
jgi:hypothetical protein